MRPLHAFSFALCLLMLSACVANQSKAAKLQDAAQNFNIATRFGRMDIASEMVAEKSLADFTRKHLAWGRGVRLVDVEFQGMQLTGKDEAAVHIAVGWQRPDEQELRVTQLMQTWQFGPKGWKLVDESRTSGDMGLLGEQIDVVRPDRRADVHFKSVTIPSPD
jgi:hypothetical protein